MIKNASLAGTGLVLLLTNASAQELIKNGGFEHPFVPIDPGYSLEIEPSDWKGKGDLVVQGYANATDSAQGRQWLDLNPGTQGREGVYQSVELKKGEKYRLSFLYVGSTGPTDRITIKIGDDFEWIVSTADSNVYAGDPWLRFEVEFKAVQTGLSRLHFIPDASYAGGFIDAVSLLAI